MPAPFDLPFVQRGVLELALLAVGAGVVGTWIVLRGLAFYAHAVGTAAFPGLVLADGLGFAAMLGAAGTGLLCAIGVGALSRSDRARDRYDSTTALVLCGALALGVILASDVFHSGSNVETLLFGSLLVIDTRDLVLAGAASGVAAAVSAVLGHHWLVTGFDPETAPALGVRSAWPDAVLLGLVALVAVAALTAVGALLATALLVVPAATTRLLVSRMRPWQLATVALVLVEGVAGVWLAVEANAPPGATIAVLGGGLFLLAALARALGPRRRTAAAALAAAGVLALGAAGCGGDSTGATDGRLAVVATTTQIGDFARAVGGDAVSVTQLLHANTDPHEYEPRPSDVQAAARAKLVLTSGDGLDHWIGNVVDQAGGGATVVDAGARRPVKIAKDPHWWHDPRNAEAAVRAIRDAFAGADPANKATYERNAAAYVAELRALDAGIARCTAAVPASERKLVTDHDAFAYFAKRYDIAIVGAVIPSTTTQAQPSAGEISKLAATIRREGVRAIFPESSLNPRLARAIAKQTGARVGGTLYADTLGPKGSPGATYLGAERHNADEVVLGFTAGRRGCSP